MRHDGVENSQESFENEGLGTKEFAVDFAVLGRAGQGCAAASFAPLLRAGFGEEDGVLTGWVVGCEVGGQDEVFGVVGEVVGVWFWCVSARLPTNLRGCRGGLLSMALLFPSAAVLGMMLSIKALSFWKRALFLTINFEKSRVPYCPSTMACTNGRHNLSQTSRKLTTSLAAAFARESHTAPTKRLHSHDESSSLSMADADSSSLPDADGGNI